MITFTLETLGLESPVKVDAEANILRGTQVMKMGEAIGHGVELDGETLDQVVALGNAKANGIKTRFGHPSLCNPGVGTVIGRRKNFRRIGDYVIADLHFSDAANVEYKRHILELAKNDPDLIGSSVVVSGTELKRKGEDADGNPLLPLLRVTTLSAVDIVDDPAAGDGLFGAPIEGISLSSREMVGIRAALDNKDFVARALDVLEDRAKALGLPVKATEAPAPVTDAQGERERVTAIMEACEGHDHLSAATKDFPRGLQRHAIESAMSENDFLREALTLANKAAMLAALHEASDEIPVESCEPNDSSRRPHYGASLSDAYFKRFSALGYNPEQAKSMATEAAQKGI